MSEQDTSVVTPSDLESLAAFIDGRLEGESRDAVVARLAADENFYEVYAETLHFLEAESPTPRAENLEAEESDDDPLAIEAERLDGPGTATPQPIAIETGRRQPRHWPIILSVAAGLAVAGALWLAWSRSSLDNAEAYIASFEQPWSPTDESAKDVFGWPTMRGSEEEYSAAEALAVRTGILRLRLSLALRASDMKIAEAEARALDRTLGGFELLFFDAIEDVVKAGDRPEIESALKVIEDGLSLPYTAESYQLGLWLQACTTAADHGDTAWFDNAKVRRSFEALDVGRLVPRASDAVERLSGLLRRPTAPETLALLRGECSAIGKKASDDRG